MMATLQTQQHHRRSMGHNMEDGWGKRPGDMQVVSERF